MSTPESCRMYRAAHLDKERARARSNAAARYQRNMELLSKLRPLSCDRCGYAKCFGALDFHHTDPAQKEGKFDSLGRWLRQLTPDKFVARILNTEYELLCANCHRELHYEEGNIRRKGGCS